MKLSRCWWCGATWDCDARCVAEHPERHARWKRRLAGIPDEPQWSPYP